MFTQLVKACPEHLYAFSGLSSMEWHFQSKVEPTLQPKLAVAPGAMDAPTPSGPPVLAVDVLWVGDGLPKQEAKKQFCARFGVRDYWVVDPFEPSLTAFELGDDGKYRTITKVSGDELFVATSPVPARIVLTEPLKERDDEDDGV